MSLMINKTTFEERIEDNENIITKLLTMGWTQDPVNPGAGVDKKYWKFVDPDFVEMNQAEKDALPKNILDITPRQFRQALVIRGISIASIEAAIAGLPEPTKTLVSIELEYSNAFQRSRPMVAAVGAMLGMNSAQLDDLWLFAGTL